MLICIALPLVEAERASFLELTVSRFKFYSIIIESSDGLKICKKACFTGPILKLNEHTHQSDEDEALSLLKSGKVVGLMSDGGAPCIGDPGATLVRRSHQAHIEIKTHGIHSYVLSALVASGCNANQFSYLGYLPKITQEQAQVLKRLHALSGTWAFIETPYRFQKTFETCLNHLPPKAWLAVSIDLGLTTERTGAKSVADWKKSDWKTFLAQKPLGVVSFEL